MEIRQMEYFIAAAETRSFSKAAAKCYVVQPTISHQISNLEEELGVLLFDRTPRGTILTEAGEFMLPKARALVAQANEIYAGVDQIKAQAKKRLRIGYYSTCIDPSFGAVVYDFAREKDVFVKFEHLDFFEGAFFDKLNEGDFDFVMTLGKAYQVMPEDKNIRYVPLYNAEVKLVLSANHPLAARGEAVTKEELLSVEGKFLLYAPSYDENIRQSGIRWHSDVFGIPSARIEVARSTFEMQLEIEAGNAAGLMVETEIRSLNAANRIAALKIKDGAPLEIGMAYNVNNQSDLINAFIARTKVI